MTILPLTYLGNIEYFGRLLHEECIIDLGEHYVKQTYRNRCEIMTPNGIASLTVHVHEGGSAKKRPMRDIRIDNSKRWQHQHWRALVSAYGKSPYFEHYCGYFEKFYAQSHEYLSEFNLGLLALVAKLLKLPRELRFSESYVIAGAGDTDMRGQFKPSKTRHATSHNYAEAPLLPSAGAAAAGAAFAGAAAVGAEQAGAGVALAGAGAEQAGVGAAGATFAGAAVEKFKCYEQVFADRQPFVPNLSVIDLLFCEGPSAKDFL